MQWTTGTPPAEWDITLAGAGGHFLQSSHWAAFQEALGRHVFYAYGPAWQCMAVLEPSKTGIRLYCPYGPLATTRQGLLKALSALRQLAQANHAIFVRVEPLIHISAADVRETGLHAALKDIQPRVTWVQDLTQSDDNLMAAMTPTNRNLYRTYHKKGVSIRTSPNPEDMPVLIRMIQAVAARNHIVPHSAYYFETMARVLMARQAAALYIAEHEGAPIASAFCFDGITTRYYAHAAAIDAARKLHPGSPLVATMMFDAKKRGQRQFDFVGVMPPDAPQHHPWSGLTKFKQSFGGDYKTYHGTWELPVQSIRYTAYRHTYRLMRQLKNLRTK